MVSTDEIDRLRFVERDLRDDRERRHADHAPDGGAPTLLVQTTTVPGAAYPTKAAVFFACTPLTVLGTEKAGSAGTTTAAAGGVIYALNVGSQVPTSGTQIIVTHVDDRWVFRYDG